MKNTLTFYDSTYRDRFGLCAWKAMFRELAESRELIYRLVFRNVSGQFRQSFLGLVWVALPPIAIAFVFTMLRKANIVTIPDESLGMPYALFALLGTTIWGIFKQTTIAATTSIANSSGLVSKIYFPREVLVLSGVGNVLVTAVVNIVVVALTFGLLGFMPHWQLLFFPLLLLPMFAFSIGVGMLLAPINTMMHDMSRILDFLFQFGLFLAPIIYPTPDLSRVESSWQVQLYFLHNLNPITHFIHAIDSLAAHGTFAWDAGFTASCILSFFMLALGWRVFHACEPLLAERL